MEPEILRFEDIIKGCAKKWKLILGVAIITSILAVILLGKFNEDINYEGNFKTLIKSDIVENSNGVISKKDPNLIPNIIEIMKTRDFIDNAIKRTNLNLTYSQVATGITLQNISGSDFIQVKYSSLDKDQTNKVINAIKDELLEVTRNYNDDIVVSIEESIQITEIKESKNNKFLVALGFIGGFGLSFVATFIFECLSKSFKTKGEVYRELKLSIIADIPKIKKSNSKLISNNNLDVDFNNAFNSLAAEIKYGKKNKGIKSIAIVSSVRGEGTSTVASNLALALSNSNKVLLIDANYKNNEIEKILDIKTNLGLTDIICKNKNLEDVLVKKSNTLDIIPTGNTDINIMALVDSKKLDELLESTYTKYDYIILDTPAIQAASESKILLRKVDGNILVIKAESTKKDIVKSSIKDINNLGGNLIGISFNFGDRFRNKYYTYKK